MWRATNPQLFMVNCAIQAWSNDGRIHYNARDVDGTFGAYSVNSTGVDRKTWSVGVGHRGLGDVTPDGKYAVITKEFKHTNMPSALAEPGKGAFSDVVLTDGITSWPLTPQSGPINFGVIWPCFHPNGKSVVWAQSYFPGVGKEIFGRYRMMIAQLNLGATNPLGQVTAVQPEKDRFFETYGWINDRLLFCSDMGRPGWWNSQIFTSKADGTDVQMVSDGTVRVGYGDTTQYAEFAKPLPDGSIMYCTGVNANWGGMDHWIRPADGGHPYKVTDLSHTNKQPPHLATSFVFSPDFTKMVATYAYDANAHRMDAYMFDLVQT